MTKHHSQALRLETYSFVYGDSHVPYRVERKTSAAGGPKKVTILVHPNCEVVVSAPEDTQRHDIHNAVMKRAKWIHDSLQEFNEQQAFVQHRQYVSGEMQFYLGRRHVLKVIESAGTPPQVKMERGKLVVSVPNIEDAKAVRVRELIRQWYRLRAQYIFKMRLEKLLSQTSWVDSTPEFRILSMKKQWGSCSARGLLMLNPHLVKAPRECIDYVILHELCHIEEHNHGDRFYRLLGRVMPGWKNVKRELDGMAELLLND